MKTTRSLIVSIVLVLLCGAAFSQTPTITLNVPLQMNDLHPNVLHVRLICHAYDDASASHSCATGRVDVDCPASGDINQTVAVVMTQDQGCDITRALSYSAIFQIVTQSLNGVLPSESSDHIECRPKEGTPFTPIVRGDVHF